MKKYEEKKKALLLQEIVKEIKYEPECPSFMNVSHLFVKYQRERKALYFFVMLSAVGLIALEKYLTKDMSFYFQACFMAGESLVISLIFHFMTYPSLFETNTNLVSNFILQFLICVRISNFDLCLPMLFIGISILRNLLVLTKKTYELS